MQFITAEQILQGILKVFIIKEINEGIHCTVEKNHDNGELVKWTTPIHFISQVIHKIKYLLSREAKKVKQKNNQKGFHDIRFCCFELGGTQSAGTGSVGIQAGSDALSQNPQNPTVTVGEDENRKQEVGEHEIQAEPSLELITRPERVRKTCAVNYLKENVRVSVWLCIKFEIHARKSVCACVYLGIVLTNALNHLDKDCHYEIKE